MPPFDILSQDKIYQTENVKRRRQLEDRLKSDLPFVDDDEERFLSSQYRSMIYAFEDQDALLYKYIKLLIRHGRFKHDELLEIYKAKKKDEKAYYLSEDTKEDLRLIAKTIRREKKLNRCLRQKY